MEIGLQGRQPVRRLDLLLLKIFLPDGDDKIKMLFFWKREKKIWNVLS